MSKGRLFWLLHGQDTRISRGDGGSVFVLVKEVSFSSPIIGLDSSTTAIVPVEDAAFAGVGSGTTAIVPAEDAPYSGAAPAPYLSVRLLGCITH